MYEKIKSYVDGLFASVEESREVRDLHDEILQNTYDRYNEGLASGKREKEAYEAAIEAIGDTRELLAPFGPRRDSHPGLRAAAIALYVMCVVPVVVFGVLPVLPECIGVGMMFVMVAVATALMICSVKGKITTSRILRGIGISLYIVAVIPVIVTEELVGQSWGEALGVSLMFAIVAGGTVLLILAAARASKEQPQEPISGGKAQRWQNKSTAERIAALLCWCAAGIGFCLLTAFGHWKYAWLLFPLAAAVSLFFRGFIRLVMARKGGFEAALRGLIWLCAVSLYWDLARETELWIVGGLIFAIAACIEGVVNGIFTLVRGGEAL